MPSGDGALTQFLSSLWNNAKEARDGADGSLRFLDTMTEQLREIQKSPANLAKAAEWGQTALGGLRDGQLAQFEGALSGRPNGKRAAEGVKTRRDALAGSCQKFVKKLDYKVAPPNISDDLEALLGEFGALRTLVEKLKTPLDRWALALRVVVVVIPLLIGLLAMPSVRGWIAYRVYHAVNRDAGIWEATRTLGQDHKVKKDVLPYVPRRIEVRRVQESEGYSPIKDEAALVTEFLKSDAAVLVICGPYGSGEGYMAAHVVELLRHRWMNQGEEVLYPIYVDERAGIIDEDSLLKHVERSIQGKTWPTTREEIAKQEANQLLFLYDAKSMVPKPEAVYSVLAHYIRHHPGAKLILATDFDNLDRWLADGTVSKDDLYIARILTYDPKQLEDMVLDRLFDITQPRPADGPRPTVDELRPTAKKVAQHLEARGLGGLVRRSWELMFQYGKILKGAVPAGVIIDATKVEAILKKQDDDKVRKQVIELFNKRYAEVIAKSFENADENRAKAEKPTKIEPKTIEMALNRVMEDMADAQAHNKPYSDGDLYVSISKVPEAEGVLWEKKGGAQTKLPAYLFLLSKMSGNPCVERTTGGDWQIAK